MPDFIAEGFVSIIPDFTQFDTLLQAKITAALGQIQAAQASTAAAGAVTGSGASALAAAAPGFASINNQATAATQTIQGQFVPALNTVPPAMKNMQKASDDAGTSLKGLQSQFSSLSRLAPLLVAGLSVKAFADFQKATTASESIFGDSSKQIIDFAQNLSTQFGLTQAQVVNSANLMGQALQQFGFSPQVAIAASEQLIKRAADLAAAFGTPIQTVLKGFSLALEGNTRILKPLGIDISAVDQKMQSLKDGFGGTVSALTDGQKAFVNQQLILKDSARFAGEAATQSDNLSQSFARLKAEAIDAAKNIGEGLAPSVNALAKIFGGALDILNAIPGPLKGIAVDAAVAALAIKAFGTASEFLQASLIGPALTSLGTLFGTLIGTVEGATAAFFGASTGLEALGAAGSAAFAGLSPLLGPAGLIFGAIGLFSAFNDAAGHAAESAGKFTKIGDTGALKKQFVDAVEAMTSFSQKLDITFGNADTTVGIFIQNARKQLDTIFQTDPNTAKELANLFDPNGVVGKSLREKIQELETNTKNLTDLQKQEALAFEGVGKSATQAASELNALFTSTNQLATATDSLNDARNREKDIQDQINTLTKEGGKQELIDAQDKLTNATDAHTQALARQKAAQEALNDLVSPATQREMQDATDGVTLAQIGLNDALRAQKAAQDALNRTNEIHLDLTGKSLSQIRDAIDNARATAAANQTVSKGKTPAELQDDLAKANIGVTQASEKLSDAQDTLNDTINKGNTAKLISKDAIDKITQAQYNLAQANNAVTSTTLAQDKAQFELNQKLAGQTNYAKQLDTLQKSLTSAKDAEQKAQKQITEDTAKQADDLNTINGVVGQISNTLRQNLKDNSILFAGNTGLQTQVIKDVISQLGGQLDTAANFQLGGLGPVNIQKLFAAIQNDPSSFKQLLKQFGVNIPGFTEGTLIKGETFAHLGEGGLTELVLPLTKTNRAWELLAQSLPHMSLPLRERLEPVIRPEMTRNLGNVHTSQVTVPNYTTTEQMQTVIDLLSDIKERSTGDLDLNIYPTSGMSEEQLIRKIREEITRILGGR